MMAHLAPRHLAVLTLLTVALVAGSRAVAEPSLLLADPGEPSGDETMITFDDLGLTDGGEIPTVEGVEFTLSGGGPATYLPDYFPREFGPQDPGSLINFWGYDAPYPDLTIRFPGAMHRMSFELRTNDADDVSVTLLASGAIVDEVTIPSRGSDQLYFYGYENPQGFDEVLLDVRENVSGAMILDNLAFEPLDDPQEEGPPPVSCIGFTRPLEELLENPENAKYEKIFKLWMKLAPVVPLRARLVDADGFYLGDEDLIAPPRARVLFIPAEGEEALDVTAETTNTDSFVFHPNGFWRLIVKRYAMETPGTYVVTMESGDEAEYSIDPTCSRSMIKTKPKEVAPKHHSRRHHGH